MLDSPENSYHKYVETRREIILENTRKAAEKESEYDQERLMENLEC